MNVFPSAIEQVLREAGGVGEFPITFYTDPVAMEIDNRLTRGGRRPGALLSRATFGRCSVDRRQPLNAVVAGEIIVLRARRALAELDAAREEIAALKGLTTGRLVLGAMQALAGLDLPRLIAAFHAAHPGVDVSLREDSTRDMLTMTARGEIDLAIATLDVERPAGLKAAPLIREPVLVAMPAAHRLASLETVPVRRLRGETFIFFKPGTGLRTVSEQAAERAGFVPRVGFQTSSHDRLLALVGEGLGVAFVPASAVSDPPPRTVAVRPASPAVDRTVGVVWRADHRHTPAASAFLALLRERASLED